MTKIKRIIATAVYILGMLFLPTFAFGADWGAGVLLNSDGSFGISIGVGSGAMGGWSLSNPYGLPQGSILGIASNLLFWLLAIFAILGVVGFIISGVIYLVSAGDDDMITRAKNAMRWSIVGIIVGLSGFIIMQAVSGLLSGGSKTF